MDHYIEIALRSDPEFAAHQMMSALYGKLHRALVATAHGRVGVSFPDVNESERRLGGRLRLHGSQSDLCAIMQTHWLVGMHDHVDCAGPTPVPRLVQHRNVRRVQVDSNPERLRRRLIRRHHIDADAARERIPDSAATTLKLPFVRMKSGSTGQHFALFIEHGPLRQSASSGAFSSYGFSPITTIPWF